MLDEESVAEMGLALDDYFLKFSENRSGTPEPFPAYENCTRDEWRYLFSEIHEALVDPSDGEDYSAIERDLQRLCKGSKIPKELISTMCSTARQEHPHMTERLYLYKSLIFALEEESYENAAKIRDLLKKYQ